MALIGVTPACLVYSRTAGYRHGRIPGGIAAVRKKGASAGLACLALAWIGCSSPRDITAPAGKGLPERIAPRLYRGELDGRGLLFFAASDTAMTLAYDTLRCGLYEVWRGPVLPADTAAAAPYAPTGPLFHRQEADTLWRVRSAGVTLAAHPRFLGADMDGSGYLTLHYALDLPGGKSIHVDENPGYDDHYGDRALRQEIRFTGLDTGMTVSLRVGGRAYAWPELWSLSANGALSDGSGTETLETGDDGISVLKVTFERSFPGGPVL